MSSLKQTQEQKLKLSIKQFLHANLLQLNAQLLEQRILKEISDNPVLELSEEAESVEEPSELEEIDSSDEDDVSEIDEKNDETDFEWEELMGDPDEFDFKTYSEVENKHIEMPLHTKKTVTDNFLDQLNDINASEEELEIAEQILGNLDDHGYLNIEPVLISDRMKVEENSVLEVMEKIRYLDPPGFASRNMKECLIAQLSIFRDNELSMNLLVNHFDDFAEHKYDRIISRINCSEADLKEAIEVISQLNPHPGDGLDFSDKDFVIPDICIENKSNEWVVTLNDSSLPDARISKYYLKVYEDNKDDKKVKDFLGKKIESAKWFIEALRERDNTIRKVVLSIIEIQSKYLESSGSELKPMVLKDIATKIDMDISTVSRVTNSKYIQFPWGVKHMKSLFSEGIKTKNGEEVSSTIIKELIKKMINDEDKKSPALDEEITKILNKKGYVISRRTVSKYRKELNFPVARLRTKL